MDRAVPGTYHIHPGSRFALHKSVTTSCSLSHMMARPMVNDAQREHMGYLPYAKSTSTAVSTFK